MAEIWFEILIQLRPQLRYDEYTDRTPSILILGIYLSIKYKG